MVRSAGAGGVLTLRQLLQKELQLRFLRRQLSRHVEAEHLQLSYQHHGREPNQR